MPMMFQAATSALEELKVDIEELVAQVSHLPLPFPSPGLVGTNHAIKHVHTTT